VCRWRDEGRGPPRLEVPPTYTAHLEDFDVRDVTFDLPDFELPDLTTFCHRHVAELSPKSRGVTLRGQSSGLGDRTDRGLLSDDFKRNLLLELVAVLSCSHESALAVLRKPGLSPAVRETPRSPPERSGIERDCCPGRTLITTYKHYLAQERDTHPTPQVAA